MHEIKEDRDGGGGGHFVALPPSSMPWKAGTALCPLMSPIVRTAWSFHPAEHLLVEWCPSLEIANRVFALAPGRGGPVPPARFVTPWMRRIKISGRDKIEFLLVPSFCECVFVNVLNLCVFMMCIGWLLNVYRWLLSGAFSAARWSHCIIENSPIAWNYIFKVLWLTYFNFYF